MELPQIISVAQFDPGPPGPTYTQILHETLGPAATPGDGFDAAMADLAAVSNAFAAEVQSSPLIVDPGAIGGALGAIDPTNLDAHMAGYVGAMEQGNAVLAQYTGIAVPQLLELPITPEISGLAFRSPIADTHDFGTVILGAAPQVLYLGEGRMLASDKPFGITDVTFFVADPVIWNILSAERTGHLGVVTTAYSVSMTPAVTGAFLAQVNYVDWTLGYFHILTLKVNVIP